MTNGRLPAGWTLEEIRRVSGDREATLLDNRRVVTGWPAQGERLRPGIVLRFHGLCLVQAVDDDDWYMGSLNDDGGITCWSVHGDLHEALRGL